MAAEKVVDATKAGVVGDGTTLNSASIQKATDNCAAKGGCKHSFPAGRYLTSTIQIKNNVTLQLEKGAVLLGSTEIADYRNLDPFIDGSGNPMGYELIVAVDASNVRFQNVETNLLKPDARPATVFIDVADLKPVDFVKRVSMPK
jgi:hypothetical protein